MALPQGHAIAEPRADTPAAGVTAVRLHDRGRAAARREKCDRDGDRTAHPDAPDVRRASRSGYMTLQGGFLKCSTDTKLIGFLDGIFIKKKV
jgi:hypothetical protein